MIWFSKWEMKDIRRTCMSIVNDVIRGKYNKENVANIMDGLKNHLPQNANKRQQIREKKY